MNNNWPYIMHRITQIARRIHDLLRLDCKRGDLSVTEHHIVMELFRLGVHCDDAPCVNACPFGAPTFGPDDKMVKCDGCIDRQKAGLEPACVRACAFKELERVVALPGAKVAVSIGASKIGLADSAGKSALDYTAKVLEAVLKKVPVNKLNMHIHNTEGFGIANAYTALCFGILYLKSLQIKITSFII